MGMHERELQGTNQMYSTPRVTFLTYLNGIVVVGGGCGCDNIMNPAIEVSCCRQVIRDGLIYNCCRLCIQ